MAVNTGLVTSYQNTELQQAAIAQALDLLGWQEAALLKMIKLNNESKFDFISGTWPTRQYEWLSDTQIPETTTIAEDLDTSETGVDVAAGTGKYFRDGDVIKINSEYMRVTGVSTDTLTVTRAYAGTTAAAHTTGDTLTNLFSARLEGQDATDSATTEFSSLYNMRQILETTVKVSGSEQVYRHVGIDNIMDYHLAKAIGGDMVGPRWGSGQLVKKLMNAFYYGKRHKAADNTDADAMGGIEHYVTANVTNLASAALTRKDIVDLLQTIYEGGGSPNYIVTSMWGRRKISAFFEHELRSTRSEKEGGRVIEELSWEGGMIDVMYDRWCPTNRLYVLNLDLLGFLTIRPFDITELAKTGDSTKSEVVGEYGFAIRRPNQDHGYLHTFSTTR